MRSKLRLSKVATLFCVSFRSEIEVLNKWNIKG
jgi:hypothetical protein